MMGFSTFLFGVPLKNRRRNNTLRTKKNGTGNVVQRLAKLVRIRRILRTETVVGLVASGQALIWTFPVWNTSVTVRALPAWSTEALTRLKSVFFHLIWTIFLCNLFV